MNPGFWTFFPEKSSKGGDEWNKRKDQGFIGWACQFFWKQKSYFEEDKQKSFRLIGRIQIRVGGDVQVVSLIVFNSDDPSSIPDEVSSFVCKNNVWNERK